MHPQTYPLLRIAPGLVIEPESRTRFLRNLQKQGFVARPESEETFRIVPEWVYQRTAPPRLVRLVGSCSTTEDPRYILRALESAIDLNVERQTDGHEQLRAALSEAPATEADLLATRFGRASAQLLAANAAELPAAFEALVREMVQCKHFGRLVALQLNCSRVVQLETICRNLMSLERWGWHASKRAVDTGAAPAAAALTGSLLQLAPYLIMSPLVQAPFIRGVVFSRHSVALVGIFMQAMQFSQLEGNQVSVESLLTSHGGPAWGRPGLDRFPVEGLAEIEEFYGWYVDRLNALYSLLWNPCNFAAEPQPFSEQFKTYHTLNSIAYDAFRLRSCRDLYLAARLSFGLVDKIANVVAPRPADEPAIAKTLLSRAFFKTRVDQALLTVPTRIGRFLEGLCGGTAYDAVQSHSCPN